MKMTLCINPLPPSDHVRKEKKYIVEDVFSSLVLSQFKKYYPSGTLKFNNLGISLNLKLCNLMGKSLRISLNLNFTRNT